MAGFNRMDFRRRIDRLVRAACICVVIVLAAGSVGLVPARKVKAAKIWDDFAVEAGSDNGAFKMTRYTSAMESGTGLSYAIDTKWFKEGISLVPPTEEYPIVIYDYSIEFGADDLTADQLALLDGSAPYYVRLNFQHDVLASWVGKIGLAQLGSMSENVTYDAVSTLTIQYNDGVTATYQEPWEYDDTGYTFFNTSDSTVLEFTDRPFAEVETMLWQVLITAEYSSFSTYASWGGSDVTLEFSLDETFDVQEDSGDSSSGDSGSGGSTTIVLPSNAVELYSYSEITYADGGEAVLGDFSLKAGEKYLVIYDGKQYELEAISINELESGAVGMGGIAQDMKGQEVTLPISVVYSPSQAATFVLADYALDGTKHTIAVYHLAVDYGDLLYDGMFNMVQEVDNPPGVYMGVAFPLLQSVDYTLEGQIFTIEYDGKQYVCEAVLGTSLGMGESLIFGNLSIVSSSMTDTGEPFVAQLVYDGVDALTFGAYDSDLVNKEIKLYFGDQTSFGGSGDSGSGDSGSGGSGSGDSGSGDSSGGSSGGSYDDSGLREDISAGFDEVGGKLDNIQSDINTGFDQMQGAINGGGADTSGMDTALPEMDSAIGDLGAVEDQLSDLVLDKVEIPQLNFSDSQTNVLTFLMASMNSIYAELDELHVMFASVLFFGIIGVLLFGRRSL